MYIKKVHHVAIIVSDYEKSKDFYVRILGFEILHEVYRENRKSYKLDLKVNDYTQIELFSFEGAPKRMSQPEACGLRHLAFAVDDVAQTVLSLEQKGVQCEPIRVDEYTAKEFTFFVDPDGLPLEIYQG